MNQLFDRRQVTLEGLFDLSHLESHVLSHLQRVYACLAMGLISAAAGAYIGMYILPLYGLVAGLVSLGLVLYLHSSRDDLSAQRHAVFVGFCALAGSGLAPLIGLAIDLNPSILVNAIIVTLVVTVCFSAASLLAKTNRWMMLLAGPLASGLAVLMLLNLVNLFARSEFMFDITLKLTLLIFSAFMVYDTQKIIEMARHADKDYILHCLDLFLDVVEIFRVVLVLFIKSQGSSSSSSERSERKKRKD